MNEDSVNFGNLDGYLGDDEFIIDASVICYFEDSNCGFLPSSFYPKFEQFYDDIEYWFMISDIVVRFTTYYDLSAINAELYAKMLII